MKNSLKLIVMALLAVLSPEVLAEGVASMTDVTAVNGKALGHHILEVSCRSQDGKTFVDLRIRPDGKTPLTNCDVTIYGEDGKKQLVGFSPKIDQAPNREGSPKGSRISFHVSDELIDRIQIRYHLHADDHQTHVFTIKPKQLRGLSELGLP